LPEDYTLYQEQKAWQDGLASKCTEAIRSYLKDGNRQRRIDQLQTHEFVGIAWAVIQEYDQLRHAKAAELLARGVDPGQLLDPLERLLRELK
jgi:hypothetical protein